jgi:hypothetical protein
LLLLLLRRGEAAGQWRLRRLRRLRRHGARS